jgi:type IV fimbrial biogenesis protein FimT
MVTLGVVSLVLMWGVPAFFGLVSTSRLANAANGLVAHLQLARLEAVSRNTLVAVCPSTDGESCDAAVNPQDWTLGYLVATVDAQQNVVEVLRRADRAEFNGLTATSAGTRRFVFESDGSLINSIFGGTVRIEDSQDNTRFRQVVVNDVGRAFVQ